MSKLTEEIAKIKEAFLAVMPDDAEVKGEKYDLGVKYTYTIPTNRVREKLMDFAVRIDEIAVKIDACLDKKGRRGDRVIIRPKPTHGVIEIMCPINRQAEFAALKEVYLEAEPPMLGLS